MRRRRRRRRRRRSSSRGTERKISHLLYMDDLKLLGRNENDLENEMKIVQEYVEKEVLSKAKCM